MKLAEGLKILVVDDEPLAREALRNVLAELPGIAGIFEAFDQRSCLEGMKSRSPDVVFLDIRMPETNLLELVGEIARFDARIPVIFVTAHSDHAVMAFEQHAADYVLKPFSAARIAQAIETARERIRTRTVNDLLRGLPELLTKERSNRFAVKTRGRIFFLESDEVHWIQANGNYVMLHCEGGSHLIRGTLADIESSLSGGEFLRIHRSVIVNAKHVREVQPWHTGEYILKLRSGKELTVSRTYKQNLARIASLYLGESSGDE